MSYLIPENECEEIDFKKDYFYTNVGTFGLSGFCMDGTEVGNFCFVCKAPFSGKSNTKLHFEGRKHAAKLKQYNDSKVQLIVDPINDANQEKDENDPNKLALNKYCNICEAELNTFEQRQSHYNSEKHQRRVRNYVYMQMGIRDITKPSPSANKMEKIKEDPDSLSKMEYCHLCKIELSAPVVAKAHYNGKKHAKKKRDHLAREQRENLADNSLRCDVCDIELNSDFQYNEHIASTKHIKKEKLSTDFIDRKIRELERQKEQIKKQKLAQASGSSADKEAGTSTSNIITEVGDTPENNQTDGGDQNKSALDKPKSSNEEAATSETTTEASNPYLNTQIPLLDES